MVFINIIKLIDKHKKHKKLVTVTAVQPKHRYGDEIKNNLVTDFNNDNPTQNIRINGVILLLTQNL